MLMMIKLYNVIAMYSFIKEISLLYFIQLKYITIPAAKGENKI